MINNKWCLLCGIFTIGLILSLSTTAFAEDLAARPAEVVGEGVGQGGEISAGPGATGQKGDVVYRLQRASGYFFRPFPGYRDYDGLNMETGGELIQYTIDVVGINRETLCPDGPDTYDVETRLHTDPFLVTEIPGTRCDFVDVPVNAAFRLTCKPGPGITIPATVWLGINFSTECAGWLISDCDIGQIGDPCEIGSSGDFFCEEAKAAPGSTYCVAFGDCTAPDACDPDPAIFTPCSNMLTEVKVVGQPWACCDPADNTCENILGENCDCETQIFTRGTLCNDLDPPCSKSGACCDKATGQCRNTFESDCQGFAETFTAGASCVGVECEKPENVPTVTQWGMIVLSVMLLAGLTIKFGRRRRATA